MYEIRQQFIPGLPKDPYRHGVGAYEGVVAHCTASPRRDGSDTPTVERLNEANHWQVKESFVHFFCGVESGRPVIIQVSPLEYKSWGCGGVGNQRFVNVELCMYDDQAAFQTAYGAYVWLIAKLLHDRGLGVRTAKPNGSGTLWAHNDVTRFLGDTDHVDPIAYLREHGVSWWQFVTDVEEAYAKMEVRDTGFPDVPPDAWYAQNVIDLRQMGIVHGRTDGKFHPDEPITRAEAAKMIRLAIRYIMGQ